MHVPEPVKSQWNFLPPDSPVIDFTQAHAIPYFIFFLWACWTVFWLGGLIFFVWRLKTTNDSSIRMRSPTLVILSAFGAEMAFSCTAWDVAVTRAHYPCCLDLYYILIFMPLYFAPFVLRFMRYLITMWQFSQWQAGRRPELREKSFWLREGSYVAILGIFISFCMAAAAFMQFYLLDGWVNAYGCELRQFSAIILMVLISICFVLVIIGYFVMRKVPDPYKIKYELVSCFAFWMVALVPYLSIYMNSGKWGEVVTESLGLLMFVFIAAGYFSSVIWPVYLSYQVPPEDAQKDRILSTVEEMLLDDDGYRLLLSVAQIHHGAEMCECARDILRFREIQNEAQMRAEARRIYDTYVVERAPRQCNFGGSIVEAIFDRLDRPTSDLYNRAYQELSKLLQTNNFFKEAQRTPEYLELVKKKEDTMKQEQKRKAFLVM